MDYYELPSIIFITPNQQHIFVRVCNCPIHEQTTLSFDLEHFNHGYIRGDNDVGNIMWWMGKFERDGYSYFVVTVPWCNINEVRGPFTNLQMP